MIILRLFIGISRFLLHPRLQLIFLFFAALGLQAAIFIFEPAQSPVVLYKLALVTIAAILAVFCDVAVFPFARPDSYLDNDWRKDPDADRPGSADYPIAYGYESAFVLACLRRAIIIAAFVLAVALGL
ncbi:MAG: putative holin [Desulfarculales bacterium]|jgi:hypothetical protein|nr:putative holin [Desulfarculales bacterium]